MLRWTLTSLRHLGNRNRSKSRAMLAIRAVCRTFDPMSLGAGSAQAISSTRVATVKFPFPHTFIPSTHLLLSLPDAPFECDICLSRFLTTPGLTSHYSKKHKGAPLPQLLIDLRTCDICGKLFKKPSKMRFHARKVHGRKAANSSSRTISDGGRYYDGEISLSSVTCTICTRNLNYETELCEHLKLLK